MTKTERRLVNALLFFGVAVGFACSVTFWFIFYNFLFLGKEPFFVYEPQVWMKILEFVLITIGIFFTSILLMILVKKVVRGERL
jgi:hypothetical protein